MSSETLILKEGKTFFRTYPPKDTGKGYVPTNLKVFYNPQMVFNRDLSLMVCSIISKRLGRPIAALEPLSGCGVRGIRFGVELKDCFQSILLNDINHEAYSLINDNVRMNRLRGLIYVSNEDANYLMRRFSIRNWYFDYVDIDPFGSPTGFIDSAIRSANKNTVLAFTATDMSVLCGVYPLKALRKYGGLPIRSEYCHEVALRLLLNKLNMAAGSYEMAIKPLASYYADHYVRAYIAVVKPDQRDESAGRMTFIEHCFKCLFRDAVSEPSSFRRTCPYCGSDLSYVGPIWGGKIADEAFIRDILSLEGLDYLQSISQIRALLTSILQENNMPISYYDIHVLCDLLQVKAPKMRDVINGILDAGYKVTNTHFSHKGIKTDAPLDTIKKVLLRPSFK